MFSTDKLYVIDIYVSIEQGVKKANKRLVVLGVGCGNRSQATVARLDTRTNFWLTNHFQ